DPRTGGGEGDAEGLVLAGQPRRAEADDEPSAADVVDGGGDAGEQGGVAEGDSGDQNSEARSRGRLGEAGEQGPAVVVAGRGLGVEVVPGPQPVVAGVLEGAPGVPQARVGRLRRR